MPGYEYGTIGIYLDASGDVAGRLKIARLTEHGTKLEPSASKKGRYNPDKLHDDAMPYVYELLEVNPSWRPCGTQGLLVRDSPSHPCDYAFVLADYRSEGFLKKTDYVQYTLVSLTPVGPEIIRAMGWREIPCDRTGTLEEFRLGLGPGWTLVDEGSVAYYFRSSATDAGELAWLAAAEPTGEQRRPPEVDIQGADDPVQALKVLKTLFDQDLISEGEYEAKKTEILRRL